MNKKYVKVTLVAVVALIGGINVFNTQKSVELSDIAFANVEALASGDDNTDDEEEGGDGGGGLVVKCFCKQTSEEGRYICSAMGSFVYCSGDSCANHDSNCR